MSRLPPFPLSGFRVPVSGLPFALLLSCATSPDPRRPPPTHHPPLDPILAETTPARALPTPDAQKKVDAALDAYFQRAGTRRSYIMVDKPLYQPGETVWFKVALRQTGTLLPAAATGVTMSLVSP